MRVYILMPKKMVASDRQTVWSAMLLSNLFGGSMMLGVTPGGGGMAPSPAHWEAILFLFVLEGKEKEEKVLAVDEQLQNQ